MKNVYKILGILLITMLSACYARTPRYIEIDTYYHTPRAHYIYKWENECKPHPYNRNIKICRKVQVKRRIVNP